MLGWGVWNKVGGQGAPAPPSAVDGQCGFSVWRHAWSTIILHCFPALDWDFGEGAWEMGGYFPYSTCLDLGREASGPPVELSGGVLLGGWPWTLQEIKGWDLHLRLWLRCRLEGPSVPGWQLEGGGGLLWTRRALEGHCWFSDQSRALTLSHSLHSLLFPFG